MIWATFSSRSCFCWLYRVSASLAAKNVISLISVLTIWWSPCVVLSCVVGRGCLLWSVCFLGKTLLAFALLHFVFQGQISLLLQLSLDFLLLHASPLWWKEHLFWVSVLEGLIGLQEPFNSSFFSITVWGIYLDYCDREWFALEINRDRQAEKDREWIWGWRTLANWDCPTSSLSSIFACLLNISKQVQTLHFHCPMLVSQSCLTLRDAMDCSLPGSSVHGILQARIVEWVATGSLIEGIFLTQGLNLVSCLAGRFFTIWATMEAQIIKICIFLP